MSYTLHLGDCLEFMKTLPDGAVDAVITDPPYGIGKDYGSKTDDWRPNEFFWVEVYRVLSPDGSLHMTTSNKHLLFWLDHVERAGFKYMHCSVYWNTRRRAGNWNGQFAYAWEPILHFKKTKFRLRKRMMVDIFEHDGTRVTKHPAERNLKTWISLVDLIPGETVFDPFMGSGTTGVAAVKLGRNFIGCEIDPGYYEIARKRIENAAAQLSLLEAED